MVHCQNEISILASWTRTFNEHLGVDFGMVHCQHAVHQEERLYIELITSDHNLRRPERARNKSSMGHQNADAGAQRLHLGV